MSQPVKNSCTPATVYGGNFKQTIFLGCSVVSFTASVGWNEQITSLTVELVEDPCSVEKVYYDIFQADVNDIDQTFTGPDPGFIGENYEIAGCPVYFRFGDFEYTGIIQNYEKSMSESGYPKYTVTIVDPREILAGCEVIIGDYAGSISGIYNLYNAYGYAESFGTAATQITYGGAEFGSDAGAFGGANINNNGMAWNDIAAAINALCNTMTPLANAFSPYGRILFRGPSTSGYGLLPADTGSLCRYFIDISSLPVAPSYWRVSGTSANILDMVSQVCEAAGYDYYIELIPIRYSSGPVQILKLIKIRTVSRAGQPALNHITSYINSTTGYIDSTIGRELRNETTSAFVIGGQKQMVYAIEQDLDPEGDGPPANEEADDVIQPYYGLDEDGNCILAEKDADDEWFFDISTASLQTQLQILTVPNTVTIKEFELRCALISFDMWLLYVDTLATHLNGLNANQRKAARRNGRFGFLGEMINAGLPKIVAGADGLVVARQCLENGAGVPAGDRKVTDDMNVIYSWIKNLASTYYGKKFMVRVPYTAGKIEPESTRLITSEQPSDGGWTDDVDILGLVQPLLEFFTLEDGRARAFMRFGGISKKDTTPLNPEDYGYIGTDLYVKAEVEEDYVYIDKSTLFSPRIVFTIPVSIHDLDTLDDNQKIVGIVEYFDKLLAAGIVNNAAKTKAKDLLRQINGKQMFEIATTPALFPEAAACGLKSNINRYGTWQVGSPVPGKIKVETDDGLVPWEYGGTTTMNLAGQSKATESLTEMYIGESGTVRVAGYPTINLGAELNSVASLIENRTISTGTALGNTYGYWSYAAATGTYGPNVTGITINVGPEGLVTTYTMKTFTPRFGRFYKGNADRLKTIGKYNLTQTKRMRQFVLQNVKRNAAIQQAAAQRAENMSAMLKNKTPHFAFVGKVLDYNGYKLTEVATIEGNDLPLELVNITGKAFMSLDGLLRPVHINMSGEGGSSQHTTGMAKLNVTLPYIKTPLSYAARSPVYAGSGSGGTYVQSGNSQYYFNNGDDPANYYKFNVSHATYHPYVNPTSVDKLDTVTKYRSDTPDLGHDIAIIGRTGGGTGNVPTGGIDQLFAGYEQAAKGDYTQWYNTFAYKGPMLLHSWGYDIDGKPVPNKNIDDTGTPQSGLSDKFADNHLRRPETWPVAPIDFRYDRVRNMWVAPQPPRVMRGEICQDIGFQATGLIRITGDTFLDPTGGSIQHPVVIATNILNNTLVSGDRVLVQYDVEDDKYYVHNYTDDNIFPFRLLEWSSYANSNGARAHRVHPFGNSDLGGIKEIRVYNDHTLTGTAGYDIDPSHLQYPAPSGFRGLARWVWREASNTYKAEILALEKPYHYISFNTTGEISGNYIPVSGSYSGFDGNSFGSLPVYLRLPKNVEGYSPPFLSNTGIITAILRSRGLYGTAVLDPETTTILNETVSGAAGYYYNILDYNESLLTSNGEVSGGCGIPNQIPSVDAYNFTRRLIGISGVGFTYPNDSGDTFIYSNLKVAVSSIPYTGDSLALSGFTRFAELGFDYESFRLRRDSSCPDGRLWLYGGLSVYSGSGDTCVPTGNDNWLDESPGLVNSITAYKGIRISTDARKLRIGSYVEVASSGAGAVQTTKIVFPSGFTISGEGGDCNVANLIAPTSVANSYDYITDIAYDCDTDTLTYTTRTMKFNSLGWLVEEVAKDTTDIVIPCVPT